jgi:hypothetical protein
MDVTRELLPEHSIEAMIATENDATKGIHNGETLAYRCLECGVADENAFEMIYEEDCRLQGQTAPTAYDDRQGGAVDGQSYTNPGCVSGNRAPRGG